MDIQIQAPDGSIVLFPEGTDDATIENAMRQAYPPSKPVAPKPDDVVRRGTLVPVGRTAEGDFTITPSKASTQISKALTNPVGFAGDYAKGVTEFVKRVVETAPKVSTGEIPIRVIDKETGEVVLNPDLIERAFDMATIITPGAPGAAPMKISPPSSKSLVGIGKGQLKRFRNSNVRYNREGLRVLANDVENKLKADGIFRETAPETFRILDELKSRPTQPDLVSRLEGKNLIRDKPVNPAKMRGYIEDIQGFRADKAGKHDGAGAERLIRRIYDFIENPKAGNIVSGNAANAAKIHAEARANFSAGKTAQNIENKIKSAKLSAASSNSGKNVGNRLRQKAAGMADPDKPAKARLGLSDRQVARLDEVAEGTRFQNVTRDLGNRLGGQGGFGSTAVSLGAGSAVGGAVAGITGNPALGAAVGGTVTAGVALSGAAMKGASSRSTKKMFELIGLAARMDSPVYKQLLAKRGGQMPALARAILLGGAVSTAQDFSDQSP